MPTKVKFDQWFRSQFGKRPSRKTEHELQMLVVSAHMDLSKAQDLLARVQLWENHRTAASYAWQAREKIK